MACCEQHYQRLNQVSLQDKLQQVFAAPLFAPKTEAEQQLYQGFLPDCDKRLLAEVRNAGLQDFSEQQFHFSDKRYNQLLFNYRARYFAGSLSVDEQNSWQESCKWRLSDPTSGYLTLEQQEAEITLLLSDTALSEEKREVLAALQAWAAEIRVEFSLE